MSLRLKKNTILDGAILYLTIVMLCFKDYNTLAYATQVIVFGIVCYLKLQKKSFVIRKYKINYLEYKIVFILWCLISCIWAMHKADAISCSVTLLVRTMTGFSIIMYVDDRENRNKMIKYMIIAAGVLCVRMAVSVPISAWGSERVGNYLSHNSSNSYGNTGITYVLGIVCVYLFPNLGIVKKAGIRYILILVFSIFSIMSGSKKHVIILIICILIVALYSSRSIEKTLRNLLIGAVSIAVGLAVIMHNAILYEAIGRRLLSFMSFVGFDSTVAADASSVGRGMIIKEAIRVFKQNPIWGVGIANFRYYDHYALIWAENNYLELLADVGIIGLILYYLIYSDILKVIRCKFKRNNPDILLLVMLCICLLFIDLTMVSYTNTTLQFHLACLLAFSQIEKQYK